MLNPERIELVRLRLGLTKSGFAKALGIDRKTVQRFEAGTHELSQNSVDNLIKISGYPQKFFESGKIDYPNSEAVSFRSLRSLTATSRNAALAAGALAFELDDWINERFELPDHSLPQLDNHTPTEAAIALRTHWGIGERPIGNMINMLESHGVRVFSLSEGTRHLDAYSFWRNDKPYVFLNTMKTPEHSRFDGAHELGHLVLHRHGGPSHRNAEDQANAFASAFLMPIADVKARLPFVHGLNDLIRGKKRWKVSTAALAYTLHKQGVISDWHYRGYCIELNKLGRTKEPHGIESETSQVWQKILTDLWREGVTITHIADALKIPEHELSNLLFGIAAAPNTQEKQKPNSLKLVE
ncbi:MAG: ImmA/IrrE family metallo-endopeptidase [Rhodospirillales bacterium]|jgi:Zn-dependent peptidase ImmA (M78 family)/DNA-binding XRE family transcriptional regulator|nr:ImmA/IrrE family metallo-endopeptidase [Rhodospirillales bacterium]